MTITWHKGNAEEHFKKHGVTFEEAATVFEDFNAKVEMDNRHGELRYTRIGRSSNFQLLRVTYVETMNEIEIITVRKASPANRKAYEAGLMRTGRKC